VELRQRYQAGGEIAIVDAREEGVFHERHLLMASCLPLSRLELTAPGLLPRRSAPVVLCDDGEGLAERAAVRLIEGGYTEVSLLTGGVKAWEAAGFPVYSGVHVPSKAFAEVVEHEYGTPWISAEELAERQKKSSNPMVIFDSRSYEEYHSNSIPGAISVPGAELVYRFRDLVRSPDTFVVVNCGGRTRSIIGAQSLIDAGVPNRVVSLKDGTMAWHLAGLGVAVGATSRPPEVSPEGVAAARQRAEAVARRYGVPVIDRAMLAQWQREADRRTLYVMDVRDPDEYRAGHLPGSVMAPGGQLVQETDNWLGVWGARVVLVDDTSVRARMTASWLRRMGWDAAVLESGLQEDLERGTPEPKRDIFPFAGPEPATVRLSELQANPGVVVDLALSRHHRQGHIPGAWFAIRARLAEALDKLPAQGDLVLTSEDGTIARYAAAELRTRRPVKVLAGGTAAWKAAGLPLETGMGPLASEPDDAALSARDRPADRERYMREYLAWEIELVNQIGRDEDCRFRLAPVA
jgi:rhodanese-related sulfurtransferase